MVIGGDLNTYVITGLRPLTEYEVTLTAVYKDKAESENVLLSETTGNQTPSTNLTNEISDNLIPITQLVSNQEPNINPVSSVKLQIT